MYDLKRRPKTEESDAEAAPADKGKSSQDGKPKAAKGGIAGKFGGGKQDLQKGASFQSIKGSSHSSVPKGRRKV
jgi:hypothetical protein